MDMILTVEKLTVPRRSYLFSWWQNVNINQWHASCEKPLKVDQLKPIPWRNNGIQMKIFLNKNIIKEAQQISFKTILSIDFFSIFKVFI